MQNLTFRWTFNKYLHKTFETTYIPQTIPKYYLYKLPIIFFMSISVALSKDFSSIKL